MSGESLLVILVVGLIAGWLAGQIVQGTGFGLVGPHYRHRGRLDRELAASSTRNPPRVGHHFGDHQRHHRRADTPVDHQAGARRRPVGRRPVGRRPVGRRPVGRRMGKQLGRRMGRPLGQALIARGAWTRPSVDEEGYADGRRLCAHRGYSCFWRHSGSARLGGSSEPRTERIRNPKIAVSGIEPSVSRDRQFYLYLWATFSSPTRCIHNHQDELRVSSLVPEIEAPAPAPTPPAPAGASCSVGGDRINRRHVIEPLMPTFAVYQVTMKLGEVTNSAQTASSRASRVS
jgi:hypothetical protein